MMVLAEFPWQIFMSPFGIPIAAIIGVFGWLAIASISEAMATVMCNRDNAELKAELVARGFSSEEIVRIVQAGEQAKPEDHSSTWHAQNPTTNTAPLS